MRIKLLLLLCMISQFACAQTKDAFRSPQAFYLVRTPGIVAVDKDDKPLTGPQVVCIIYLEGKDSLEGANVLIDGTAFQPNVLQVTALPMEAGRTKADRKQVVLQPSPGNKLWKLSFVVKRQNKTSDELLMPREMILRGMVREKTYQKNIQRITELESPMFQ
jgi:hypothetical protein